MNLDYWLALVKEGGGYCAVLELGALIWVVADRTKIIARLVEENADLREKLEGKSREVKDMAERVITLVAELRMFLFNERKI